MKVINLKLGMIATNCYIIYDEVSKQATVVDPAADVERILTEIKKNDLSLTYIFLTHGHFDHIMAVADLKAATGAQIVVHEDETGYLPYGVVVKYYSALANKYKEVVPDVLATDAMTFTFGDLTATYYHTPGHTTGSSIIQIGDSLFTGDTLFRGECGRCDLPGGDFDTMLRSLKKIYDMEGDFQVYPGHEAFSTLAWERDNNQYMKMAQGK